MAEVNPPVKPPSPGEGRPGSRLCSHLLPIAFHPLHPQGLIVKVEAFARPVAEVAQPSLPSPEESSVGEQNSKAQLSAQPQPCTR